MNIAEQVIRAKQDLDEVYSAGQSSMVDPDKLIPKTVSGSYISVDDVSEIPHDVKCKVESANLWTLANEYVVTGNGENTHIITTQQCSIKEPTTFSCAVKKEDVESTANGNLIYLWVTYADSTHAAKTVVDTSTNTESIVLLNGSEDNPIVSWHMQKHDRFASGTITISNIMLNRGTTALPYTPYVKPEEVKVTRTGKNLATAQEVWAGTEMYVETVEDERNAIRFITSADAKNELPIFEENTQYTFSFDVKAVLRQAAYEGKTDLILRVFYTDGTNTSIYFQPYKHAESVWEKHTLTTTAGKTIQSVGSVSYAYYHWIYVDVDTFQVEKGATATEYEPYNGQTITPDADGTVEGMTSVSPYMNVFSDTDGVNIEVTYNKSYGMQTEYDRFWDNFNSNHPQCAYGGTYWSKHTFKPKHDIVIPEGKQATQLFFYHGWWNSPYDLDAQLKACGVVLDFSKSTGFSETFRYACFTKLPEISTVSASSLQGMFNGMQWLKEIVRLVLKDDGSQTFTSQYSGKTFENCSSLTSITIAGVIGQDISFQWCPLTKASITNIINTLSSTATGQTLTLKLSAVNTAFETSAGANDGSTSAEFAALVATKTNWTITMI